MPLFEPMKIQWNDKYNNDDVDDDSDMYLLCDIDKSNFNPYEQAPNLGNSNVDCS